MRGCARALASVVVVLFGIDRFSDLTDPASPTSGSAGLPAGTDRIFRQTVHTQPVSVGSDSTMVLKKWNKVYVRTTADKGIVMLLVEKLITTEAKDTRWTAVDPALNIQAINMKNASTYSTKAQTNVTYSPIPGFTKDEKSAIEKASWEFVRKALAGRDVEPMKRRVHVGKPRLRALIPLLESLGVVASLFGSGPGLGLVSVLAFVGWRTIRHTRLDRIFYSLISAGTDVINKLDVIGEKIENLMDAHEDGELEPYYIGFGLIVALLLWARWMSGPKKKIQWWRDRTSSRPLDGSSDWGSTASSSPASSPRSPRLFGTDASCGETSDEYEDIRMKTMRDRQTAIEKNMTGLAEKLDTVIQKLSGTAGERAPTSTSRSKGDRPRAASPAPSPDSPADLARSEEVRAGVDRFLERLNATQNVLDTDRRENLSTNATCGDSPKTARAVLPGLTDGSALNTAPDAGRRTQQLEGEAVNPKDAALAHLRRYQDIEGFKIGGDASVRVAPSMVAKLYKYGRTASRELEEFVRSRGLEKCHAAMELPTLGLILDRLVVDSASAEVINMPAVEVVCRKVYGLIRAFEDVKSENDWKMPKGANAGKWKSKVKWTLLQEYDVKFLDSSDWSIPEADREVADRLQKRALFNKHLSSNEPDSSIGASE